MQIHLFRQPIFFFARRLIHPMLNKIGVIPNHMNTYNILWDINANVSRTSGLLHSFYLSWQIRKLLQARVTPSYINNLLVNYNENTLNTSILTLLNRNNLPFMRIINFIIFSVLGNMFNFSRLRN